MRITKITEIIKDSLNDCIYEIGKNLYWDFIHRKFKHNMKKGTTTFKIKFKHKGYRDNEILIEHIAKNYGYEISDEFLTSTYSKYTFSKYNHQKET